MSKHQKNTAIVILAAGASTRLGSPKQLVKIGEKYLLEHMVETALKTAYRPIIIVLGAYAEEIRPTIKKQPVHIIENKEWESGMGSTISHGIKYLKNNFPKINGTVVMLTDQPFVTSDILGNLEKKHLEDQAAIVVSTYDNTSGPPAYFHKSIFRELINLSGKNGAKSIFEKYKNNLSKVLFEDGAKDIDTPEDILNYLP